MHQATVVATVRVPGDRAVARVVTETFGTMTADLLALRDWLQAYGVTHVALESTGVYWKPVYYVLEDAFTLLLINMQELKRVPGRKTDVKDSEWLAQLLECGLLQRELRAAAADPGVAGSDALSGAAGARSEPGSESAVQGPGRRGAEADQRRRPTSWASVAGRCCTALVDGHHRPGGAGGVGARASCGRSCRSCGARCRDAFAAIMRF